MEAKSATILRILLVEDNEDDVFFFEHALKVSNLNGKLIRVANSRQAIAYLKAEAPFQDRTAHPFPDIVITDMKMSGGTGLEFLEWLKNNPKCRVIPTLILSSSEQNADVQKAYELGVNAYVQKPQTIKALGELMLLIYLFWSNCLRPHAPPDFKCP